MHTPDRLDVMAIRRRTCLSQRDFAVAYGFGIDQLKQWEQRRASPVRPLRAYLTLIEAHPEDVRETLVEREAKRLEPDAATPRQPRSKTI